MCQVLSEKKIFPKNEYFNDNQSVTLDDFFFRFRNLFVVHRRDNISKARSYILGLLKCEKNHTNMERMVEQVPEQAYHQYHNFLSESKWDSHKVNDTTALETSALLESCKAKSGKPTGYIIDESSHLKKGTESVGVARQYAGVSGKVDNCQVAVYSSLCNEVERSFDDAKNELGLSGYQIRKWNGWQHHQSLTMMAGLYMLIHKLARKPEYELMSLRDTRIMIIANLFSDQETIDILHNQMLARHKNRKRDIDRFYKNE